MSSSKPILAIDAMGGDHGPKVILPGAFAAAKDQNIRLLLVGNKSILEELLPKCDTAGVDFTIVHAPEVMDMKEKASDILRRKKDASIYVACTLVADGKADGVVSAGHSGASAACGTHIIKRVHGVERPALASILPTEKNPVVLLDVGAMVDCKPSHLFQFGLMGHAFAQDLLNLKNPRIGLLSIGEEEGKGNSQVKEAYDLLKKVSTIHFIGNIEGRDLFSGNVDVAVCDGFVGNIVLKLSEGLSTSLSHILKRELLHSGLLPKLGTLLARSAFRRFAKIVDYAEYGGAPLVGLNGIVIVCHGASNSRAITSATRMAALFVEKETNKRLVETICTNEALATCAHSLQADNGLAP